MTKSHGKYLYSTEEYVTEEGRKKSVYLSCETLIVTNSATVGMPKVMKIAGCIHDGFLALLDLSKDVDRDYLYYFFLYIREHLTEIAPLGTQKNLNTGIAKTIEVPIPDLVTQRRIVETLDAVENLAQKREQTTQLADRYVQSAFLGLFGDPLDNPKHWSEEEIRNVSIDIQPGFAFGKFNLEKGIPHLRPFNISASGWPEMRQVKYLAEKDVPSKYLVKAGDLIFNNTNSEELVGKTAIFRLPIKATLSNHMTRIRLNTKVVLPEYVWFAFNRLFRQGVFARMCKRWVNQAAVDTSQLSHLKIPIPDIRDQQTFASLVSKMEIVMHVQSQSNREINELFHTLIQNAFKEN